MEFRLLSLNLCLQAPGYNNATLGTVDLKKFHDCCTMTEDMCSQLTSIMDGMCPQLMNHINLCHNLKFRL